MEIEMKYTKIKGTYLNFQTGKKMETGILYSKQEQQLTGHRIIIHTYENGRVIETILTLQGPDFLDFESQSDDPRIPVITGRFLNTEYEESLLRSSLPDKKIDIHGVVTKLDDLHALSTKTLIDSSSGKVMGIMQEQVELISASAFKAALNLE